MCIVSNTYRIGKVRIEYVSYRQGPYRIRIVSARSVSNTYRIGCWPYRPSPMFTQITVSLYVLLEEYSVSIRKYTNISLQKGRAFFKPMTKSPPDKNPLHYRDERTTFWLGKYLKYLKIWFRHAFHWRNDVECMYLKNMTAYLKRWKRHENWGKSFFCPTYKNMISPLIEWCIGKYPGLRSIFFKTSTRYLKFMHYHASI